MIGTALSYLFSYYQLEKIGLKLCINARYTLVMDA